MDIQAQRWIEIQFYFICVDLLKINNNIKDVLNTIDFILSIYKSEICKAEYVKSIASFILKTNQLKPTKLEYCCLATDLKIPISQIQQRLGNISRQTYYNIIECTKDDPIGYYTRLDMLQFPQVEEFVRLFNKFKGVASNEQRTTMGDI